MYNQVVKARTADRAGLLHKRKKVIGKMIGIDVTSIVLGCLTLAGGCGWVIDRRKYKVEVKKLEAEVKQMEAESKQKYMDLAKEYVEEFRKNIGEPLQQEVGELRKEVKELKDAVEGINDCPYRAECPVRDRMRHGAAHGDK